MLLFIFHDVIEEFTILKVLGDEKYAFLSFYDFIKMKNVGVSYSLKYFDLSMNSFLILDCQLGFLYNFDGNLLTSGNI